MIDNNKESILIYLAASHAGTKRSMAQQAMAFRPLEEKFNLIYISGTKTPRGTKTLKDDSGLKLDEVIYIGEFIGSIYNTTKNPETYQDHIESRCPVSKFINDNNINVTKMVCWGGIFKVGNFSLDVYKTTTHHNFHSILKDNVMIFSMMNILQNKPKIEFVNFTLDPLCWLFDPDVKNKSNIHEHSTTEPSNFKRFDGYQYYLLNSVERPEIKDIDFAFGMTAFENTPSRIKTLDFLKDILKNEEHFYYKTNKKGKKFDNLLERQEYSSIISRAKFTIIAAAYVPEAFSITRLCESVYNNCCPYFMLDCNFEVLRNDFGIIKEDIQDIIIGDALPVITEKRRLEILEYLYDKLFTNIDITIITSDAKTKNPELIAKENNEEDIDSGLWAEW